MNNKTFNKHLAKAAVSAVVLASLAGCSLTTEGKSNLEGYVDQQFSLCVPWTREDFLVCDFTYIVRNNGSSPENIVGASVFLSSNGNTYQAKAEDQWTGGSNWVNQTINPGEDVMFRTSFEVPKGSDLDKIWVANPNQRLVTISIGLNTSELE